MRYVLLAAGLLAAIAVAVGVILVAMSSDATLVLDLERGDCIDLRLDGESDRIDQVDVVDCAEPHTAEVVAVGSLDEDGSTPRPPDEELFAIVDARCAAALQDRPDVLEEFGILPVAADEASWDAFDGRYVCLAIAYLGEPTTGSLVEG